MSGTDGVGTKLKIAFMLDRHDTVGIDLVAMCVNDVLVSGAEPLFFLDYLSTGKLAPQKAEAVVKGIAEGCRQAGCALIGGETAEMPSFYADGEYDLAGFAVGVVDRPKLIDGSAIRPGDVLIGLGSTGLHSNGYSLARRVLFEKGGLGLQSRVSGLDGLLGDVLLAPTRIYVKPVLTLVEEFAIKGIAHITGGGLTENLPRVLPRNCRAVVDRGGWPIPAIFDVIQKMGSVEDEEMYRVFNMGVGLVLVVSADCVDKLQRRVTELGERAYKIGEISAADMEQPRVEYVGSGATG